MCSFCFGYGKVDEKEHSIAIRMRKVIEHKPLYEVCAWQNVLVLVGLYCVGNFRDILFSSRDTGHLGNLIKGIISNLLKGILDTFLFTSRDIEYWYPPYTSLITVLIKWTHFLFKTFDLLNITKESVSVSISIVSCQVAVNLAWAKISSIFFSCLSALITIHVNLSRANFSLSLLDI